MPKRLLLLMLFSASLVAFISTRAAANAPAYFITSYEITLLKNQPLSLLSKFPDEGSAMAQYISRAVIADPSVVDSILSVSEATSPAQAAAMGAGLARAARVISVKQPKIANAIAERVRRSAKMQVRVIFEALGPNYRIELAPILSDNIPPLPLTTKEVGDELPEDQSRIGPERETTFIAPRENATDGIKRLNAAQELVIDYVVYNEVYKAIITSDAPHNNAVSTSPTQ